MSQNDRNIFSMQILREAVKKERLRMTIMGFV